MTTAAIYESIYTIINKYDISIFNAPEYKELEQKLKSDIALETYKKTGKQGRFKAALKFSKQLQKKWADAKPGVAGAYIQEDGRQCLVDNCLGVRYDEPYDGLVTASGENHMNLGSLIDVPETEYVLPLPTLAELKTELKTAKAEGRTTEHGRCIIKFEEHWFDIEYLIQAIELVEPEMVFFSKTDMTSPMILCGDGAKGCLMPVSHKEDM